MDDGDRVLVGSISAVVLQALKAAGVPAGFYALVLVVVGGVAGGSLAWGRQGSAGVASGAVEGIAAALAAAGTFGVMKAMAEMPPRQPRDKRGRFVKSDTD